MKEKHKQTYKTTYLLFQTEVDEQKSENISSQSYQQDLRFK